MYATGSRYGSELLEFVGWLVEQFPPEAHSDLSLVLARHPEIAKCISRPGQPVVVQVERAPIKSLLTEKGSDASDVVRQLTDAYAQSKQRFEGISQIGVFELCNPLSADHLRFYRVLDVNGHDYRLEETGPAALPEDRARGASSDRRGGPPAARKPMR
jgi:hypothetical protein